MTLADYTRRLLQNAQPSSEWKKGDDTQTDRLAECRENSLYVKKKNYTLGCICFQFLLLLSHSLSVFCGRVYSSIQMNLKVSRWPANNSFE